MSMKLSNAGSFDLENPEPRNRNQGDATKVFAVGISAQQLKLPVQKVNRKAAFALVLLLANVAFTVVYSIYITDKYYTIAFLAAAPFGPCAWIVLQTPQTSKAAIFGGLLWYIWLISSGKNEISSVVALNHFVVRPEPNSFMGVVSLCAIIALIVTRAVVTDVEYPSKESIGLSLVFLLWSQLGEDSGKSLHVANEGSAECTTKPPSLDDSQVHLSNEDVNTEEIREEIALAKQQMEHDRHGIMDRISPLRVGFDELKLHERIGIGSFGEVYRASLLFENDTRLVAVKQIPRTSLNQRKVASMLSEIDLVSDCTHPNVIRMMGWCDEPYVFIVLEYANGGCLRDYLKSPASRLKPGWCHDKTRLAIDVAAGIAYLHGRGIIHRDIKAENMLVACNGDSSRTVKIADFGSARSKYNSQAALSAVGSAFWLAPEIARGQKDYNELADVWSFGVLLCEIATHELPYLDMRTKESFFNLIGVVNGRVHPVQQFEGWFSEDELLRRAKMLIDRCCTQNQTERPDMRHVLFELLQMIVDHAFLPSASSSSLSPGVMGGDSAQQQHKRVTSLNIRGDEVMTTNAEVVSPYLSPVYARPTDPGRISDPTSSRKGKRLFRDV
jgi:serine/threonine protein kinase